MSTDEEKKEGFRNIINSLDNTGKIKLKGSTEERKHKLKDTFNKQDKLDTWLGFIMEKDNSYEKLMEGYKQSIYETRDSLLKEYFAYKGIDYKKIELQCKNMNNFKLKDGLFHKISYSDEKGVDYYFKEEFIMREECGEFYLGGWKCIN